jgi:hypothetical protein
MSNACTKLLGRYLLFTPHSELFIDTLALINESEFFHRLQIQARSAVKEVYSLINENHSGLKGTKREVCQYWAPLSVHRQNICDDENFCTFPCEKNRCFLGRWNNKCVWTSPLGYVPRAILGPGEFARNFAKVCYCWEMVFAKPALLSAILFYGTFYVTLNIRLIE